MLSGCRVAVKKAESRAQSLLFKDKSEHFKDAKDRRFKPDSKNA